jgi:hypothetical protein
VNSSSSLRVLRSSGLRLSSLSFIVFYYFHSLLLLLSSAGAFSFAKEHLPHRSRSSPDFRSSFSFIHSLIWIVFILGFRALICYLACFSGFLSARAVPIKYRRTISSEALFVRFIKPISLWWILVLLSLCACSKFHNWK